MASRQARFRPPLEWPLKSAHLLAAPNFQPSQTNCGRHSRHQKRNENSTNNMSRKSPFSLRTWPNSLISSALFIALILVLHLDNHHAPVAQAGHAPPSNGMNNSFAHESVRSPVNNNSNNNNNNDLHQQQHKPTALLPKGLVKLGNSASHIVKNYNHASSNNRHQNSRFNQTASSASDLIASKSSDSNLQSQKKLFEKVCIGTSNRLSAQSNKTDHYQNLVERYRNCTYVIGNLEITWLGAGYDLTFLESIREITGYLLIAYVEVEKIRMPNLQIIRGRDLFKPHNSREEFAMLLMNNDLKSLEMPNLREILVGSVGSLNNQKLCYFSSIEFEEIINKPYKKITTYNNTQPECPLCDRSCHRNACWGEGPELCQKFSKLNCAPQCSQGRCFGTEVRECCHLFCAGGCTGPKQTDCLACKNFYDDDECIQECPSMMRYNPIKFEWEPNPNGKYAYGATCVKECPEHLLRDNGACVRSCPPNKRSENGECVPCVGPCPKKCQGVEVVHSGFSELTDNNSLSPKHAEMHPSRLEVFKTLREITGYLNIQANHSDFKNLSYFRNLNFIGGRQTTDLFYALSIIRTSLTSLNLRSLKKVRSGKVVIEENRDLCYVETIDWRQANLAKPEDLTSKSNADSRRCRHLGRRCHPQCSRDGCWGPGPDECLSCNNYKFNEYCVAHCNSTQSFGFMSFDSGNRICQKCDPECKGGCDGTESHHCFQCKNFKDGPYCRSECPSHKYNYNGTCLDCDKSCIDGCTGPSNKLGEGGCNSCGKPVINSTVPSIVDHCIEAKEPCPEGYYQEYVGPQAKGSLKMFSGKPICRKCHHKCKSCTGMGTHVSVCECAKYVAGEQCEDNCPHDYFANERLRKCVRCSSECNGCFGPTEADCITCRVYRIYSDSHAPIASAHVTSKMGPDISRSQVKFNCTSQCPPEKPYRISSPNMLDPSCSEDPGKDPENPQKVWIIPPALVLFLGTIILIAAVILSVYIYRCQNQKHKTVEMTMRISGFGDDVEPLNQSNVKPNLAPLRSIKETELRKGKILGSGFGGTVYQGFWIPADQEDKKHHVVAIKVLTDSGQPNMNKEFLDEAYIMASVNHPNLVRLLAVCMTPKELMLVTQLMPLGCLLDYVRQNEKNIGSKNLLEWCKQIARGMAYLEERRMVHRDLALRNVLLQTSGRALISDFGLAKLLDVDQSEYHSGGGKVPVKWLAPECFKRKCYTHKSDVWAFGVTVWELLTFGSKPFEKIDTSEVPKAIEEGARLNQPEFVTTEVYKVMYACWFYNPEDRPDFKSLAENFVNFARDPWRYLAIPRTRGIEYSTRREVGRNSDSDEIGNEEYGSDMNSLADEESQPRSAQLEPPHNGLNGIFSSEFRHHSESDTAHSQHLSTATTTSIIDANNNFTPRWNSNTGSSSSMPHTISTVSLGQKSEQPTDLEDYLLPSPHTNETRFFKGGDRSSFNKPPPSMPLLSRDPPHSAGLIGICNDEYFNPRNNYVSSYGPHGPTNASSGHIPQSLV